MINITTAIFFASLVVSVPFGVFYKSVENVETKRMLGMGAGIVIATCICGTNVFYTVLMVVGNIIAIKSCHKRSVHKISLLLTGMLLLYVYHYVGCTKYDSWLFQSLALRLVGIAFELHIYDKTLNDNKTASTSSKAPPPVLDDSVARLTSTDIAAYAYYFLGIQRGPYYTWKTFNDHLNSTISVHGDFWAVTSSKLKKALLLTLGYVILRAKYPISMFQDDDFYNNYGADYRYLICMPQLVSYFLETQIILMIITSACTASGFGVYPAKCLAVPGAGPTKAIAIPEESLAKEEYNFSMLKCFDNEKILMGPRMKDTIRGWDMPTRYFYSQYIVKNLINNNFEVRSACSFLLWTVWTGFAIQDIIIALTLWVYIHLESDYAQLYADSITGPWDLGFSMMRMFCLFYLTPCWIIDDRAVLLRYYNSITWIYHIVLVLLFVAAIAVHKSRIRSRFVEADAAPPVKGLSKNRDETASKPEGTKDSDAKDAKPKDETSSKPESAK